MDFRTEFPEYRVIAEHIRRAQVQKSAYLGHRIADVLFAALGFVKGLAAPRRSQQREA